jgi:hypothetical protein
MNINSSNPDYKRIIINQNITQSKVGTYNKILIMPCIKNSYFRNFNVSPISNVCNVKVINKHYIDILDVLLLKGIQNIKKQNIPVIVQNISREFTGSNLEREEGIQDSPTLLRTNLSVACRMNDPFPIKDSEVVYLPLVTTIRDKNCQFLNYSQIFSYSLIYSVPIEEPTLVDDEKMNVEDYMKTLTVIETAFQTAIAKNHKVLILSPFGLNENDENPIDDIIKIYNFCIYKYGHYFNNIIISIPKDYPSEVYDIFNDDIIKPQELTEQIDDKYDNMKLHSKLVTK